MAADEVIDAYDARAGQLATILGAAVSPHDPDRTLIEPWADTVAGRILDVGSGTGRWTAHLAQRGLDVVGIEPAEPFVAMARDAHPGVEFRHAGIADLPDFEDRWAGILAWYSLIHFGSERMAQALATLRSVLVDGGTMLVSFFTGPRYEPFNHPATIAYRWPVVDLANAMTAAGFEVLEQREHSGGTHASIMVRATD